MTEKQVLETADKIFQAIFGRPNPWPLEELERKMAFDIKLPAKVKDSVTGVESYSAMPNAKSYITISNIEARDKTSGWLLPKREVKNLDEILAIWRLINYTTTERVYDSENVSASDPIYGSTNVYKSTNCGECNNIIFCDGTYESAYSIACQRSTGLNYCLRVDDSNGCSNSYNVICSGKVSNSFFIQDAGSLHECMFCSHISNRKFCIANMQFDEAEYRFLKSKIIDWVYNI